MAQHGMKRHGMTWSRRRRRRRRRSRRRPLLIYIRTHLNSKGMSLATDLALLSHLVVLFVTPCSLKRMY